MYVFYNVYSQHEGRPQILVFTQINWVNTLYCQGSSGEDHIGTVSYIFFYHIDNFGCLAKKLLPWSFLALAPESDSILVLRSVVYPSVFHSSCRLDLSAVVAAQFDFFPMHKSWKIIKRIHFKYGANFVNILIYYCIRDYKEYHFDSRYGGSIYC